MSKMKELYTDINDLLETTRLSCEEIAERLKCPVNMVNDVLAVRVEEHRKVFAGFRFGT